MEEILSLVFKNTNVNFDHYKKTTLQRRINKRLDSLNIKDYEEYLNFLSENKEEIAELFNTMLIGVTEFFRDKEAFNSLKKELAKLITNKKDGDNIRIWCVGCANGSEVYSVAILLHEILGDKIDNYNVKIFGSDIHLESLKIARKGEYSIQQVQNCPDKTLKKYFTKTDKGYKIKDFIKEDIVFSLHDINADPPFLRLDLVVCRNLLIYFEKELQNEVITNFHYCLNSEGCLFLGKSESISEFHDYFEIIDTKNKIFHCIKHINHIGYNYQKLVSTKKFTFEPDPNPHITSNQKTLKESAKDAIMKTYDAPFVVINEKLQIIETEGSLRLYLELKSNNKDNNLLKAVNKEIGFGLHNAFLEAKKKNINTETEVLNFELFEQTYFVKCKIRPFSPEGTKKTNFVITFHRIESPLPQYHISFNPNDFKNDNEIISSLKDELQVANEHLETYRQEIEKRTQEAQSLNEELQSANEELKSANEELETSNEELQALNEELFSSNSSLTDTNKRLLEKEDELLQLNNELIQHKNHLEIAKDIGNYISWEYERGSGFTKGSEELLDLLGIPEKDISYVLSNQWMELVYPEDARVIGEKFKDFPQENQKPIKVQYRIKTNNGKGFRWIESITAVKENKVISVARNITEQKFTQQAINEEKERYKALFNNSQFAIFIIGKDNKIKLLNDKAASYLKHDMDHYLGKDITNLDKDHPGLLNSQVQKVINNKKGDSFELKIQTHLGTRWFMYEVQPIIESNGNCNNVQVLSYDNTEKKHAEGRLEENEKKLSLIFDNIKENITLVDVTREGYHLAKFNNQFLDTVQILNPSFKREKAIGASLVETLQGLMRLPVEFVDQTKRSLDATKNKKTTTQLIDEVPFPDGVHFLDTSYVPILDEKGQCRQILISSRDITSRVKAEKAIKDNEIKYRTLLEKSNESLFVLDKKFTFTYVSPGHRRIFGREANDLIGKKGNLNVHSTHKEKTDKFLSKVIKNPGKTFKAQLRFRHEEGHYIWVEIIARNLLHNDMISGIVINAKEITDYIEAQQEIKESEDRLKALDEASSEGIFFHANQKLIDCNSAFIRMMGYNSKEEVAQLTLEETAGPYASLIAEKIKNGYEGTYEAGLRRKNGVLFPVEIRSKNTFFNGEKGRITQIKDLTERKKIENTLQEQSAFLKSVIDTIPSYIFLKNTNGEYVIANKALSKLLGMPSEKIIGKKDVDVIPHQELADRYTQDDKEILEARKITSYVEEFYTDKDNPRYLHTTKTPLFDNKGNISGLLGISTDITDRIQAENALLESETKFRAITEHSPYATLLIKNDLSITYCSKEATNLFQARIENIVNKSIKKFISKKGATYINNLFDQLEESIDSSSSFDNLPLVDTNGNEYITEGFIVKLPKESGLGGYLIKIKDITFIKREEEKRELLNQTILQLSNNKAVHSGDLESALRVITKTTANALNTSRVSVWHYDEKQEAIKLLLMYSNEDKKYYREGFLSEKTHQKYFKAVKEKRVISMPNVEENTICRTLLQKYLLPNSITALLDAKFVYNGQFKGILCIEQQFEDREWSIEEQNFTGSLADLITIVWQNHERSLLQAALAKSESDWKSLVNNAPDAIFKVNRKKIITFTNRYSEHFPVERIVGKKFDVFSPKEFRPLMNKVFNDVLNNGKIGSFEMCMPISGEGIKWYASRVAPIFVDDKIPEVLIYTTDITERKRVEMALKEGDIRYKSMIENSTEAIWRFELSPNINSNQPKQIIANEIYNNSIIAECNTLTAKLLGKKDTREVINKPLRDLLPLSENILDAFAEFYENDLKASEIEFSLEQEDGSRKYISMYASGFANKGEITRIWGTFKDITERKEAEYANQRLLKIMEASTDFIGMATTNGKILYVNTAGKTLLGYNENMDVTSLNISDLHNEKMADTIVNEAFKVARKEGTWEGSTTMTTVNGIDIPLSQLIMSHKDENGNILFYSTVARDMTVNKLNNEKMMQSVVKGVDNERKRIASELHDSLGQLLSAASMNLESMKREAQNFPEILFKKYQTTISLITNAIIETREISHDLMPQSLEDFGLITSLESMIEKIAQAAPFEIIFNHYKVPEKMNTNLEINLYRVTQEALNNIIKHAKAKEVKIQIIKHRNTIMYSIEDDGVGFIKSDMDFEGHGINNIKNRITSLGGEITIDSQPQKGTTISIEVPLP